MCLLIIVVVLRCESRMDLAAQSEFFFRDVLFVHDLEEMVLLVLDDLN